MAIVRRIPAGDLALTDSGDLVVVSGVAQIRQALLSRFKFFKGEWFRDLREGMPYYQTTFVAAPNLELIRSVFRKAILSTPGVLSTTLTVEFNRTQRTLTVSFRARTRDGEVSSGNQPFVVKV